MYNNGLLKPFFLFLLILFLNNFLLGQSTKLKELEALLTLAQSDSSRVEVMNKIADYHAINKDLKTSLEYRSKALKINKTFPNYTLVNCLAIKFFRKNILVDNSIDRVKEAVNALDNSFLIPDLINYIAYQFSTHDPEWALSLIQESLKICIKNRDKQQEARCYAINGVTFYYLNELEKAKTNYLKSLKIFSELKEPWGITYCWYYLGRINTLEYNLNQARFYLNKSLYLAKQINADYRARSITEALCNLNQIQGNFQEADSLLNLMLEKAKQDGDDFEIKLAKYNLSINLMNQGMFKGALPAIKDFMEVSVEMNYPNLGEWHYNCGRYYKGLGIFDSATIHLHKSIEYSLKYKKPSYLRDALKELTLLNFEIGNPNQALEYTKKIDDNFPIQSLKADKGYLSEMYLWKATVFDKMMFPDSAITFAKKSLTISKKNNVLAQVPPTLNLLGELYQKLEQPAEAKKHFLEALQISQKYLLRKDECIALFHLAKCSFIFNNYEAASDYGNKSLKLSSSIGYTFLQPKLLELLADINTKLEDHKKALEYRIKLDSLNNNILGFGQRSLIVKYETLFRLKEKELQNERLKREQNEKNFLLQRRNVIIILLIAFIIILVLGFILWVQITIGNVKTKLRQQIMRDIHDDVGGILNNVKIYLKEIAEEVPQTSSLSQSLPQVLNSCNHVFNALRGLVWKIEEKDSTLTDFEVEIKDFTSYYFSINNIPYQFKSQGFQTSEKLTFKKYQNLLMIYKEALQNILKHGNQQGISILLHYQKGTLEMTIENQFNSCSTHFNRIIGKGLSNMKQRAKSINATLNYGKSENQFWLTLSV